MTDATANRVQPWLDDGDLTLYHGDATTILQGLPAGIAQTCVTSPPYWGLRDYGTGTWTGGDPDCDHAGQEPRSVSGGPGKQYTNVGSNAVRSGDCRCGAQRVDDQLGLEATPQEYVERIVDVFREVRRVLRDDGTLWLNLGDSYATSNPVGRRDSGEGTNGKFGAHEIEGSFDLNVRRDTGLKPKDLCGIPWAVAKAMQEPYYTGEIRNASDRRWLAGIIDCEGCIYISRSKAGARTGRDRKYVRTQDAFDVGIRVTNTNRALLESAQRIVGHGSIRESANHGRTAYDWNVHSSKARTLLRELYPDLVAKQHEARLALGCPPSGETATLAHAALKTVHQGGSTTVDFSAPESCYEPGWYLRSDIVWAKPNPMPESVTDRPTKSHEYLFLFSKQPRYFYDPDAIREPHEASSGWSKQRARGEDTWAYGRTAGGNTTNGVGSTFDNPAGRNRRSVWQIATEPFPEAHFATYPQALVAPCVLAGTSEKGGCSECGAPWGRITIAGGLEQHPSRGTDDPAKQFKADGRDYVVEPASSLGLTRARIDGGWTPSCSCTEQALHDDPTPEQLVGRVQPQLVLDPFIGSGTTALVARKHGRRCIGIDLSGEYLAIAAKRTQQLSLLGGAA